MKAIERSERIIARTFSAKPEYMLRRAQIHTLFYKTHANPPSPDFPMDAAKTLTKLPNNETQKTNKDMKTNTQVPRPRKNLEEAFAGESMARNNKYTYFRRCNARKDMNK